MTTSDIENIRKQTRRKIDCVGNIIKKRLEPFAFKKALRTSVVRKLILKSNTENTE